MRRTGIRPGSPRRLTDEELDQAMDFKRAVLHDPCAACGDPAGWPRPWDAHHVIAAQTLRQHHPDHLYDPRNALSLCRRCHDMHTSAARRIPRSRLRPENEEFAAELGLTHLLERYYPGSEG